MKEFKGLVAGLVAVLISGCVFVKTKTRIVTTESTPITPVADTVAVDPERNFVIAALEPEPIVFADVAEVSINGRAARFYRHRGSCSRWTQFSDVFRNENSPSRFLGTLRGRFSGAFLYPIDHWRVDAELREYSRTHFESECESDTVFQSNRAFSLNERHRGNLIGNRAGFSARQLGNVNIDPFDVQANSVLEFGLSTNLGSEGAARLEALVGSEHVDLSTTSPLYLGKVQVFGPTTFRAHGIEAKIQGHLSAEAARLIRGFVATATGLSGPRVRVSDFSGRFIHALFQAGSTPDRYAALRTELLGCVERAETDCLNMRAQNLFVTYLPSDELLNSRENTKKVNVCVSLDSKCKETIEITYLQLRQAVVLWKWIIQSGLLWSTTENTLHVRYDSQVSDAETEPTLDTVFHEIQLEAY